MMVLARAAGVAGLSHGRGRCRQHFSQFDGVGIVALQASVSLRYSGYCGAELVAQIDRANRAK